MEPPKKSRPSPGGNSEVADDVEEIPLYKDEDYRDDPTPSFSRAVGGISIGTADRFDVMVPEVQQEIKVEFGEHIGTCQVRALAGLSLVGSQGRNQGTVPLLLDLQRSGVNRPDSSRRAHFQTSALGLNYIDEVPTGSAPKKRPRYGSRNIGQGQMVRLGMKAFVAGDLSAQDCCDAYAAFHRRRGPSSP